MTSLQRTAAVTIAPTLTDPERSAKQIAAAIGDDKIMSMHFMDLFKSMEVLARGAVAIYHDLNRILQPEHWAVMPIVDLPQEYQDEAGNILRRNLYATWRREVNGTMKDFDYYVFFADDTVQGAALKKMRDNWRAAAKGSPDAPAEFAGAGSDKIQTEKKSAENAYNNYRSYLKDAVRMWQQMHRINTEMAGKVAARVILTNVVIEDATGNPITIEEPVEKAACIKIAEITSQGEGVSQIITCGKLLAYDVDRALAKGGTYAELVVSGTKKNKEPKVVDGTLLKAIDGPTKCIEYFDELHAFVSDSDKWRTFTAHLLALKKNHPGEYKDAVLSICGVAYQINGWAKQHESEYDVFIQQNEDETKHSATAA